MCISLLYEFLHPSEYTTFLGYATPPTSYGGYGGNAKESPRYTFQYPTGWKPDLPNKVTGRRGTQDGYNV